MLQQKKKISRADAIRDKKLTGICFFNQFNMRHAELLAPVCLKPCRSHLIWFVVYKKFWTSTNLDVRLLSWHIKQVFTSVNDVSESPQIRHFSQPTIYLPPQFAHFCFISHSHSADIALNPQLLCSPVLPSAMHCKAISHSGKVKWYKIPMQSKGNARASTLQASIFFTWNVYYFEGKKKKKVRCTEVLI